LQRVNSSAVLRYLLIGGAAACACYSFVLARASWHFREDTATSVPAAVRLVPYNSDYLARLAAWREPEKSHLLHRAIELNPFDSQSLIQLGFLSEFQQHDNSTAERYYLRAFDVNKMFLPRWTLANFYFRQQRPQDFFHWARETLAITPYSPEPVFTQMWLMSQDQNRIAQALPDRARILLPYAWFLSNNHQFTGIPPIVYRLMIAVGKGNPQAWGRDDLLATIEDRLVADGDADLALDVWISMVRAGWIDKEIPSPVAPITNGRFRTPFYTHGFDWLPASVDGVQVEQLAQEGMVRLQFSGDEPEQFIVLQQYVPLEAGRTYTLKWRINSQLPDTLSGLTWHLRRVSPPPDPGQISGDLASASSSEWQFRGPLGGGLCRLMLEYSRPLGHLRAKGDLTLMDISARAE
jgi:hypothetical protein